jgi:hypothetical protein
MGWREGGLGRGDAGLGHGYTIRKLEEIVSFVSVSGGVRSETPGKPLSASLMTLRDNAYEASLFGPRMEASTPVASFQKSGRTRAKSTSCTKNL